MNKFIFLILVSFSLISNANDKDEIDYKYIIDLSSDRQGDYLIRYYQTLGTFCLGYLDIIDFNKSNKEDSTDWAISNTKPLCHLFDKEIAANYAGADIDKIEFEEDLVRLHVSYFYLRKFGEYKTECTVKVKDGEFGELECEEGVREDT